MPLNTDERAWVTLARQLFAAEDIGQMLTHLNGVVAQAKPDEASLTDRERLLARQGAMNNAVRLNTVWYHPWRTRTAQLREFFRPYSWVIFPVQVRVTQGTSELVPWHQDAGYQRALGDRAHRQIVTVFTPLNEDPFRRTTLEFADSSAEYIDHVPTGGFDAVITSHAFKHMHYFLLERGDALVFGDMTPHRSFNAPGTVQERASIEYRLVQPQDAIPGKDYFDLESGRFVTTDGESALND